MQGKIKYTFQLNEQERIIFVVDYDTFAASYFVQGNIKTLLTREIEPAVGKKWLEKAKGVMKIIENNGSLFLKKR